MIAQGHFSAASHVHVNDAVLAVLDLVQLSITLMTRTICDH
jgi:hypothetical protein